MSDCLFSMLSCNELTPHFRCSLTSPSNRLFYFQFKGQFIFLWLQPFQPNHITTLASVLYISQQMCLQYLQLICLIQPAAWFQTSISLMRHNIVLFPAARMRWSIFWHCDTFSCFKNQTLPMTTFNYQSVFSVVGHAEQKAIVLLSPQLHNINGVMRTDFQRRREQAENRGKESPAYPRATVDHCWDVLSFQWGKHKYTQIIK